MELLREKFLLLGNENFIDLKGSEITRVKLEFCLNARVHSIFSKGF